MPQSRYHAKTGTYPPALIREPFHRDGWVYQENVDGWRILAYKDSARVRLVSRDGRDHTRRFATSRRRSRSCQRAPSFLTAMWRSTTSRSARGSTGCVSWPGRRRLSAPFIAAAEGAV